MFKLSQIRGIHTDTSRRRIEKYLGVYPIGEVAANNSPGVTCGIYDVKEVLTKLRAFMEEPNGPSTK